MISNYSKYAVPALGTLCLVGALSVVTAMRTPMKMDVSSEGESSYDARVPENLELADDVPSMEVVVEKHLFVKERKATGANTFPDLIVKGVYVGNRQNAVFSLKSNPAVNVRVWLDNVDEVIRQITETRDPRRSIIDFLNEWDLKEITFKGVTVEHFITGEVETYEVNYSPAKHIKDSASAGYGQGSLVEAPAQNTSNNTAKKTTTTKTQSTQGAALQQMRSMIQQMTPEQRERMAERIRNGGGGGGSGQRSDSTRQSSDQRSSSSTSSSNTSSKKSSKRD